MNDLKAAGWFLIGTCVSALSLAGYVRARTRLPGDDNTARMRCPKCRKRFTCGRTVESIGAAKALHREFDCEETA